MDVSRSHLRSEMGHQCPQLSRCCRTALSKFVYWMNIAAGIYNLTAAATRRCTGPVATLLAGGHTQGPVRQLCVQPDIVQTLSAQL